MEVNKLVSIYEKLISDLRSNPENAMDNFKSEWSRLDTVEQEVLKPFIGRYQANVISDSIISLEAQMYLTEIIVNLNLEYEGQRPNGKLNLTPNIKDVQLAKLFYDLKNSGYISNNFEEIAAAVSNIFFDVKFETIFSYLNNPSRFSKAQPLFKEQ